MLASILSFGVSTAGMLADSESGLRGVFELQLELRQARIEQESLEQQRQDLLREIEALEGDPFEIERRAREELQMIFPGERVLRCCE